MRPDSIDDAGTICRALGHSWHQFLPTEQESRGKGFWWLYLQCERCRTKRYDEIGKGGDLERRRYWYPIGYARDRMERALLRLELRSVLKVYDNEKEMGAWNK